MEYTINKVAKISGVSTRTLRYYDEIDLLKPKRINSSGYRIYSQKEIDILQQILFYKELGLPLNKIKEIINSKDFDFKLALYEHKNNLLNQKNKIELMLKTIENTIKSVEGEIIMSNKEKFECFKEDILKQNEEKYGKEIREKYGDDEVNKSYNIFKNLSKEDFEEAENISKKINETLKEAMKTNNPESDLAIEVVKLHKKWLSYFGNYTKEAHVGLGQMYVDDYRFKEYYENNSGEGSAKFLRDAIVNYYNAYFNEETWTWDFK